MQILDFLKDSAKDLVDQKAKEAQDSATDALVDEGRELIEGKADAQDAIKKIGDFISDQETQVKLGNIGIEINNSDDITPAKIIIKAGEIGECLIKGDFLKSQSSEKMDVSFQEFLDGPTAGVTVAYSGMTPEQQTGLKTILIETDVHAATTGFGLLSGKVSAALDAANGEKSYTSDDLLNVGKKASDVLDNTAKATSDAVKDVFGFFKKKKDTEPEPESKPEEKEAFHCDQVTVAENSNVYGIDDYKVTNVTLSGDFVIALDNQQKFVLDAEAPKALSAQETVAYVQEDGVPADATVHVSANQTLG